MSRTFSEEDSPASPWKPVAIGALLGALLGVFGTSSWQVAVETGQVLAGIVEYPHDNPFYRYHMSAWSLVHQLVALALYLGADERSLSIALSGALGAATFGGMTLCCHAICRRSHYAVLAPVAWFLLFRDANAYGVVYPLVLTGTHHTYGVLGRAAALWLAGLAAHGYLRAAFVLLPILPALHLTWGLFAAVLVGFAWLAATRNTRPLRQHWPWALPGSLLTIASLALQRYWTTSLPNVDSATARPYLDAFLAYWDGHRLPANIVAPGTLICAGVAVCAALLLRLERGAERPAKTFYAIVAAAAITGTTLLFLARVPEWLPAPVTAAMPGRFANFALLLFPALLVGLVGRARGWPGLAMLLALVGYLAWNAGFEAFLSSDRFGWELAHWKFLLPLLLTATFFAIRNPFPAPVARAEPVVALVVVIICLGLLSVHAGSVRPLFRQAEDPVIARARSGSGLIITGPGLELVQLRTGRPILLNTGGLDQLPYVPASGPAMHEALQCVYGVSLLEPPQAIKQRRVGALPQDASVDLFAQRTVQEWQSIAQYYGGGGPVSVLVRPSHRLAFEPAAESKNWRLYDIPSHDEEN